MNLASLSGRFRSACLLLAAATAFSGTVQAQTTTVFNETWSEGNRTTQNPPNSLDWFYNTSSSAAAVSGATLVTTATSSRSLQAYFPALTLTVGKTATLRFTFSLTGPLHGEADTSGEDNGFRFGLFYTGGAQPNANMATADGTTTGNPTVTSVGYLGAIDVNPDTSVTSTETNAVNIRKRFNIANALATSTSSFTTFTTPGVTPQPLVAGTTYTCTMTFQATSATDTQITVAITGGSLSNYTTTIDDNGSLASPSGGSAEGALTTFDTVDFAVASSNSVPAVAGVTFGPVSLTVATAGSGPSAAPVISSPAAASATVGSSFTYTIQGSNTPTAYTETGTLPPGVTFNSTTGVISGTPTQAGSYPVTIGATNSLGTGTAALTITVGAAGAGGPAITTQPSPQTIVSGTTVVFSVGTSGSSTPTYQWQLNGTAIPGAIGARLVIAGAGAANAGTYTCVVTANGGSTTSSPAILTLTTTTNVGRLINLSVNTTAGKGQLLTVGFVTGGAGTNGSQNLLIRATGPALTAFGVQNVLADPLLTVFSNSTAVATNDNWGSTSANQGAVTTADTATGAFPLTNSLSLDAALVDPLTAGGYTVQVGSNTAGIGTTVAEVYDDTPANTYTLTTPRLINVSSNDLVAAHASLTAGFVVGGTTSKTVLIRATGPALSLLGVSGTMPDPQVALHTTINNQDTVLATNAAWGGDPQIVSVSAAVGAFPLTSSTSKDSVILMTLAPGAYTAVASSASGTAGVALIEVYEVP